MKTRIHHAYIPTTPVDVQKVTEKVIVAMSNDGLELKWYNNAQLQTDCDRLKVLNLKRLQEKATRQPMTLVLKNLGKEIDGHLRYLKVYLEDI